MGGNCHLPPLPSGQLELPERRILINLLHLLHAIAVSWVHRVYENKMATYGGKNWSTFLEGDSQNHHQVQTLSQAPFFNTSIEQSKCIFGDKSIIDVAKQVWKMEDIEEHQSNWRDNKSMSGCLTYLSQNKMWHDVSFSCKNSDGKLLHGHRLILSLRSPVFEAMFFGLVAYKQGTVDIVDIEHDVFEHILRYIYTDESNLDGENVLSILYSAEKYCLSGLAEACSLFLETSMSCDNVCTIFEQAKMFDMSALAQTCFVFMAQHSSAVSLSTGSTCLSHESLMEFLSNEDLTGYELDHFRLANEWATHKCVSQDMEPTPENKRKALGDIVTKINYTMMKPEDFSEVVVPTNILLAEDQTRLFQYMITRNQTHIEKFSFAPRNGMSIIVDTRQLEGRVYEAFDFIFKFSCSANVKLIKLFPLKARSGDDLGKKNIDKVTVHKAGVNAATLVPKTIFDETGSISNDLGILFDANTAYTVCVTFHSELNVVFPVCSNIPTRKLSHTTKVGPVSCTIEEIPVCVETVEFKTQK